MQYANGSDLPGKGLTGRNLIELFSIAIFNIHRVNPNAIWSRSLCSNTNINLLVVRIVQNKIWVKFWSIQTTSLYINVLLHRVTKNCWSKLNFKMQLNFKFYIIIVAIAINIIFLITVFLYLFWPASEQIQILLIGQ